MDNLTVVDFLQIVDSVSSLAIVVLLLIREQNRADKRAERHHEFVERVFERFGLANPPRGDRADRSE